MIEDIAVEDNGLYTDDANLSGGKEEITDNNTTSQMPGFTSIMVILWILLLFIVKR